MFRKKTIGYVSEIDKFLAEFDKTHSPSHSQAVEIKKHERIYQLRDKPQSESDATEIWSEF